MRRRECQISGRLETIDAEEAIGPDWRSAIHEILVQMTTTRCIHGMDSRFCAVCNRTSKASRPRGAIGSATLPEILEFLNAEQIRATYGAVGELLGIIPRAMGTQLGPHTAERSWIVSAGTGLPTDYSRDDMHPALLSKDEIIGSGIALAMRLSAWKAKRDAVDGR
jgi:hypothetical protein